MQLLHKYWSAVSTIASIQLNILKAISHWSKQVQTAWYKKQARGTVLMQPVVVLVLECRKYNSEGQRKDDVEAV